MQDIVSLEQVKAQLGLENTTGFDVLLEMQLEEAEALCLDWVKNYIGSEDERAERYAVIDSWNDETAPPQMKAGIRTLVALMFRFRGDDERSVRPILENGDLAPEVTCYLKRLRDPALA